MNKSMIITAALALGLLGLGSCGGGRKSAAADSSAMDSIVEAAAEAENEVLENRPLLTPDSLGPVKLGMLVTEIPQDVNGLYVSFTPEVTPDAQTFIFSGEKGEPLFSAYDFLEGKVDIISLLSPTLGASVGEKILHIGDSFRDVLALPGAFSEWIAYDEGGLWYWKAGGLWFGVNEAGLDSSFAQELCNPAHPPKAASMPESATIGYIGTGLPF